jgi:hypothetical protein
MSLAVAPHAGDENLDGEPEPVPRQFKINT